MEIFGNAKRFLWLWRQIDRTLKEEERGPRRRPGPPAPRHRPYLTGTPHRAMNAFSAARSVPWRSAPPEL